MMTRLLISSSLVLSGATFVAAQDATLERDNGRVQGEIRTGDAAQQAGDRQQDQTRQRTQLGQTGRDATGSQAGQDGQKMQAKDVLKEMASANELEVQLGELAQERAQDPQVQQFARQMVEHHKQAIERIKQAAEQKDVDLSDKELAEHHQAVLDQLKEKNGEQFEAAYMFHQAGKHVQDILMAQHVATASDDQELQQLARQALPMLEQHLQQATDIAQNIATQGQAQPAGARFGEQQNQGLQQRDTMQPGQQNQGLQQRDRTQPGESGQGMQSRDRTQPGQTGQGVGSGMQDQDAQPGGTQQERRNQGTTPGSTGQNQPGSGAGTGTGGGTSGSTGAGSSTGAGGGAGGGGAAGN